MSTDESLNTAVPNILLRARGLTRSFGKVVAVDRLDLDVPRGIILGLLGDNGAGKTTLLRMALGMMRPSAGRLEVLGFDPVRKGREVRVRASYVPEDRRLYRGMKVKKLLRFAASLTPRWDSAREQDLIARFGLDLGARIGALSRGAIAKLYLAIALAPRPELLLLDEATSGIDAVARREILAGLVDLVDGGETTVIMATHQLHDVERIADQVAILHGGRLVAHGGLDELKSKHDRLLVGFDGDSPPLPAGGIPGTSSALRRRGEWLLSCSDPTRAREWLGSSMENGARPAHIETVDVSLEDLFVEVITGSVQP